MSKYKPQHDSIGLGEPCPKCKKSMEHREHKVISEKQKKATYYFREWDYCIECKHVQHYEFFKVFN